MKTNKINLINLIATLIIVTFVGIVIKYIFHSPATPTETVILYFIVLNAKKGE